MKDYTGTSDTEKVLGETDLIDLISYIKFKSIAAASESKEV